jgi:integrase
MPRRMLTDRFCTHANAQDGDAQTDYFDEQTRGLALRVSRSGQKSWTYHFTWADKRARMTFGSYPATSLGAARTRADEAKGFVEAGKDPRSIGTDDTFKAICEEYLKRECGMLRDAEGKATFKGALRSAPEREASLTRLVYPTLGGHRIGDIKRSEIVRLLDKIEDESGPVMADRVLASVRKIMNWHASRSDEFRSPIVRGMARTKPKERARKRTLTDDEIRIVWNVAAGFPGPFGALVQFILLTLARRTEAARIGRNEVTSNSFDWTLPAARNKTKVDLLRSLSGTAKTVFASVPRIDACDFVFTTDGERPISGFSKFKREFDKAVLEELRKGAPEAEPLPNWTLHDLRRTGRSLMSRAGVPSDHAEMCMGHVIGGVRETYDRYEYREEKARAFEALAVQIERIVNPQSNVLEITRA